MEKEILNKKELLLGKRIYKSAFSKVYLLDNNIIKILNSDVITMKDLEKIEWLISKASL